MAHIGCDKLYHAILTTWWWPNLMNTVKETIKTCPTCQADNLPPPPKEPYRAAERGRRIGEGWSIDLAGPFPRDLYGNTYLAVAVDTLTKWPELTPIRSKHAYRTAEWLYSEILARWAKPRFIRTDNGKEWEAEFAQLLTDWNITHCKTTTGNSKGNGLAERTIRFVKQAIRRLMAMHPDSYWSDHIPAVLIAMRFSMARSHSFPPFTVVTGSIPVLPSDIHINHMPLPDHDASDETENKYLDYMLKAVHGVRTVVKIRHAKLELQLQRRLT